MFGFARSHFEGLISSSGLSFLNSGRGTSEPPDQRREQAGTTLTHFERKNEQIRPRTIPLDPSSAPELTTRVLTEGALAAAGSMYVKLSVSVDVLRIIYEGGMLPNAVETKIPMHIEITNDTGYDIAHRGISEIRKAFPRNVDMILKLVLAGYDVSGKVHDEVSNMYSATLNRKSIQRDIKEYRKLSKSTSSKGEKTEAKTQLSTSIQSRMKYYLMCIEKGHSCTGNSSRLIKNRRRG